MTTVFVFVHRPGIKINPIRFPVWGNALRESHAIHLGKARDVRRKVDEPAKAAETTSRGQKLDCESR